MSSDVEEKYKKKFKNSQLRINVVQLFSGDAGAYIKWSKQLR